MKPDSVGIIGAGVLGLAIGRQLTLQRPGMDVIVFDKEARIAAHQSGHNSGVVHSGVYYAPETLKAKLCTRGGLLLREFCRQAKVPLIEVGKLIIARSESELSGLADIERRGFANRVPGLRRIAAGEIIEIEPHARGLAALHSPRTASVDFVKVCQALAAEIRSAGGQVILNAPVSSITNRGDRVVVRWADQEWDFSHVVVCAGLGGDRLITDPRRRRDMQILPFRGEYYNLRPEASHLVRGMIYPVPDPRYPFLGVHLTRDIYDGVHVGPNAVLATAREGYMRHDVNLRDLADILGWPGTWHLLRQHWRTGITELVGSISKSTYAKRVSAYVPALDAEDLIRSDSGVRAQAVRRDGKLVDDFVVQTGNRVTYLRNAPSPAATASLAIGEYVVSKLLAY